MSCFIIITTLEPRKRSNSDSGHGMLQIIGGAESVKHPILQSKHAISLHQTTCLDHGEDCINAADGLEDAAI